MTVIITLHEMGMNYRHDADFRIDRPDGSGDWLLLIFKSCAVVSDSRGDIPVQPDSAVIYAPASPQHYRACGGDYANHFLHMDFGGEEDIIAAAGLPTDTVIPLSDVSEAEEIMRMISREEVSASPFKERYIDMLIKMLIMKLADSSRSEKSVDIPRVHSSELSALRAELYSSAGKFRSVDDLARAVNLSPSHFQQLYRSRFGVSCYEDLLSARIKAARYYLRTTALPVREIAALCGYENDVCFMRRFKQRTGLTPTEYRQSRGE